MRLTNNTNGNYTMRQLKLPLEIEKLIDISDPVYTFCEVMDHIDLSRYFVEKGYKTGHPRCDEQKLLKVILFAFMENSICLLREIEKFCRNDIRYMYLLDGMKAPSFATFGNLIRNELTTSIEQIFAEINAYIFTKDTVNLQHTYIDGTKIEANANRYTWVWNKSCMKNRQKVFDKISRLIDSMNQEVLGYLGVKLEKREEYAIDYVSELLTMYKKATSLDEAAFVSVCVHRKSIQQKQYQELLGYLERLKTYATDMECFVPLMEKFKNTYGHYPKYPVADAGYGSYNNYLYCEEHDMEKYMKFTMYKKETTDKKYHENPYRAVNFTKDEAGNPICPNERRFLFKRTQHVKYNKYGRTEELYECESCEGCPHKQECCPRAHKNRTIRMNQELTSIHQEVLENLECIHGALLRMNRSIQSEGTFGILKWDKSYKRLFRRGEQNVILELTLISCGFNLYKYHNKRQRKMKMA